MEFKIREVLGTSVHTNNGVALCVLSNGEPAAIACVGAGAIMTPLAAREDSSPKGVFYFYPPKLVSTEPAVPGSPHGSPETHTTSNPKLIRVNKAGCVDASAKASLVAVGEASGYMPRLLLYDLQTGECLSALRDQHQFGVQHLRFSPSGRHIASLGTPQDGYLYVWSVTGGQLELRASNKCISDVRVITWLNDEQFVTAGVRHIKLWTVGSASTLGGRNMLLKEILDQTFEAACASSDLFSEGLLVGTSHGEIYKMPEIQFITKINPPKPITSILVLDSATDHVLVSTETHIFEFMGSFEAALKAHNFGTPGLLSDGSGRAYYVDAVSGTVSTLPLASQTQSTKQAEDRTLLNFKDMQLRSSSKNRVVLWRSDAPYVYLWPLNRVEIPLSDVTVALDIAPETSEGLSTNSSTSPSLIVGSLSGDLWLGGKVISAHNGPITDIHQLGRIAVSSGRDRSIQVWLQNEHTMAWELAQTLMFTSPVLKVRLCLKGDVIALVSCAANKTIYFCTTSEQNISSGGGPPFPDSPKSLILKGMPFDLAAFKDLVAVSTNDKHVSVFDPFAEQDKLRLTWRGANSNLESINLTHMQAIEHLGTPYILAAGSDKCVHLFTFPRGERMASQWGHGDPISGVAWTGSEALSTGDSLFVSSLSTVDIPSLGPLEAPGLQPHIDRGRSAIANPGSPTMPRFTIPDKLLSGRESSPVRKVFNTSPPPRARSVSPQRAIPGRQATRSPSPTREKAPLRHETISGINRDVNSKVGLNYKPLRLATHTAQPRNITAASTSGDQPKNDSTGELEAALEKFLEKPNVPPGNHCKLKTSLLSALNKLDGFSLVDELSMRLFERVEARIQSQIDARIDSQIESQVEALRLSHGSSES